MVPTGNVVVLAVASSINIKSDELVSYSLKGGVPKKGGVSKQGVFQKGGEHEYIWIEHDYLDLHFHALFLHYAFIVTHG